MALRTIIDITGHLTDIDMLKRYLIKRKDNVNALLKCNKSSLLQECSQLNLEGFNRGYIIQSLSEKYTQKMSMYNANPNLVRIYYFIFPGDAGLPDVILSNEMSFDEDILNITHAYQFMHMYDYIGCQVLMVMMSLMIDKYEIDVNVQRNLTYINSLNLDANAITFMNISLTYLSLLSDLIYNNPSVLSHISSMFPYFNLPIIIYAPYGPSFLPMLNNFPIAVFIAIYVVLDKLCMPDSNTTLSNIYQYIVSWYDYSIFPERMKLQLCGRYNIVVLERDESKYAPCFAECRQKAKDIISEYMSTDPNLGDILSRI